jgi:hypothetical protein
MRKFLLLLSAGAALAAATAVSAGADTMSFTLTPAGLLTISGPTGDASLGSQMSLNSASTLTGHLGTVTVSDQRGGAQTWVASVIASSFTPVPTSTAIAASAITYVPGTITVTGGETGTGITAVSLAGVSVVVNGTGTGVGTASWNPTISVNVPANFAAGLYTSTITHSVA